MKYVYFVAFSCCLEDGDYPANMEIPLSTPITTLNQITQIEEWIWRERRMHEDSPDSNVVITNYIFLRNE